MKNESSFASALAAYSALAAAFISSQKSEAQIVYTNIPDAVLTSSQPYSIDLNNDGIWDFEIVIRDVEGIVLDQLYAANVSTFGKHDEFAGIYGLYELPQRLNFGDIIDHNLSWAAPHEYCDFLNYSSQSSQAGYWQGGVKNGYLGVRIYKDGNKYYGWVRMGIKKDGSKIIVKDYAYEATPGKLIKAGDTGKGDRSENFGAEPSLHVYPNPASEFVRLSSINDLSNAQITIFDLQGRVIKALQPSEITGQIDVRGLADGVYLMMINDNKNSHTLKFEIAR